MTALPRRRWFQFGIGTMLILMTVLAGLLAYSAHWIHHRRALLALPGVSGVDGDEAGIMNTALPAGGGPPQNLAVDPQFAPWPLSWLGERGYIVIVLSASASEAERARVQALFPEAEIVRE